MRLSLLLPAALSLFSALAALGQTLPVLDQNPPTLRWRQVRTPHFRVIYPAGLDSAAQRTAGRLEQVHGPGAATLGVVPPPIGIVLQNQTTVSNAFVTFLPRHAEFFTTPQQGMGLGTVDWLDGLVVHEYRHIGQFDKARQGIGRVLHPLLGDGGLGVAAVGVPQWFFEGDAVGNETALTRSGRGRIPAFSVDMRANRLAGRHFDYQKAVNGSLRDNVPDWYGLGYFMTSYLKNHYGPAVWANILDRYYKFPFYPFSFSNSIRRTTGLTVEQLYSRTMSDLDSTWQAQQKGLPLTAGRDFAVQPERQRRQEVFTEYRYPQYVTDSTVVAMKTGLGDIAQLVLLNRHGREKPLFVQGLLNSPEMLSVGGGKVVWPEFRSDPRWGQRVYSELRILDLASGQLTRLKQRRYAAAALSADGQRLVAVQTDSAYHHALVLLDARTGAVQATLPNPRNDFYLQPRWIADGRLVVVTLRPAGKTIELLDPATGQGRDLLPVANINLTNAQPWQDYVLYNSPQSGIDNVYAVHTGTGQTFRVTSRPLGAYHAAVAPDGRHLAFHEFRAEGSRIVEIPLDPATWVSIPTATTDTQGTYAARLSAQEPGAPLIQPLMLARPDSAGRAYAVRPYSPLRHAFNVFSYGLIQSPAGNGLSLGIRSQDLLNTTQAVVGVGYDQTERTANVFGGLSYQGRYPVLDASVEHGGRDAAILTTQGRLRDQWTYTRLSLGGRLPFNLTRSKYLEALTLSAYYLREQVQGYDLPVRNITDVGPNQPLNGLQTSLSYVRQLKQSARDVAPRLGQTLLLTWRTTPFGSGLSAGQLGAQGSVYLPGLGKHQALRVRGGYQWQQQREYRFGGAVSFPRGENYVSFDRLRAASFDYYLPIAYTHWTLGRVLYIQRLRATGFLDMAHGETRLRSGTLRTQRYRNVGLDANVLFNVLHLRTPIETGLRYVFNTYTRSWVLEPLVLNIRI
ncbi:hypothetical protein SAMN02745146_3686 [Hymenobacter daecheongensis DSM 21074]|uniref:WD40-like Beta Propeller Repeat n=1 Tax=Hymenobacter daecheongensis DSM 21074 TaxID=1121955 RepID=A0A1M6LAC8_9BACT|nr:hypothetical protein [Hymenobacter daecheongensis]SHJ68151.1 hypothetical protein SAMN02745146_3686 [Hymenobacter daecheongensis DSM 21074]